MSIGAGDTKYGLKNTGKFTRSYCDCDIKFHRCLKNANTMISNQVGNFYFNVVGHECFTEGDFTIKEIV